MKILEKSLREIIWDITGAEYSWEGPNLQTLLEHHCFTQTSQEPRIIQKVVQTWGTARFLVIYAINPSKSSRRLQNKLIAIYHAHHRSKSFQIVTLSKRLGVEDSAVLCAMNLPWPSLLIKTAFTTYKSRFQKTLLRKLAIYDQATQILVLDRSLRIRCLNMIPFMKDNDELKGFPFRIQVRPAAPETRRIPASGYRFFIKPAHAFSVNEMKHQNVKEETTQMETEEETTA